MTEPVVFKRSIAIAMLTMLRAIAPAIVAIGTLYGLTRLYGIEFESHFMMLAVLVAILAPLILRLPPVTSMQLMSRQGPTAAGLMVRWVLLLVTLLFIGYLTKFS